MVKRQRTEFKAIRMTEEEIGWVDALAEADGVSASDAIRLLVRRGYKERFPDAQPKKKTSK
jgi:hypothetical protein